MLNDRVIRITFIISLVGHCLILGTAGFDLNSVQPKKPEDFTLTVIEIEKPPLLPRIDVMGKEKKLREAIEKLQSKTEVKQTEIVEKEKLKIEEQIKEVAVGEKPQFILKKAEKQRLEFEEKEQEQIKIPDSADEAMLRYQDMVKQRIEEARRYPFRAKKQGIQGTIDINFLILSDGASQNIKIIHPSGSKILDDEAIATIQRANPFPPIPEEINSPSVQMEVSIVFKIS